MVNISHNPFTQNKKIINSGYADSLKEKTFSRRAIYFYSNYKIIWVITFISYLIITVLWSNYQFEKGGLDLECPQKFFRLFKIRQPVTIILACLTGLMSAACSQNSSHPNIVLIFADDLGYCDSELYGCNAVPTPNIKRLATEGALFTSGYVTSPVCSPSRASILTGRYQQRFGHEFLPEGDPSGDTGLPVSEKLSQIILKCLATPRE